MLEGYIRWCRRQRAIAKENQKIWQKLSKEDQRFVLKVQPNYLNHRNG